MIARHTVLLAGRGPTTEQHRQVLATLQGHFRLTNKGTADAELVTGDRSADARLLVLAYPEDVTHVRLHPGVRVVPVLKLFPAMRDSRPLMAAPGSSFALIDITVTLPTADRSGMAGVLLEGLAAYRSLAGRRATDSRLHRFESGFTATLNAGHGTPLCTIACSENRASTGSWRLWATGEDARYVFELEEDGSARPATIRHFDQSGTREAPQVYQHVYRQTWLEVHALLCDPHLKPRYGLSELTADVATVQQLMSQVPARVVVLT